MARQVPDGQAAFDPFTNTTPVRTNIPRLRYLAGDTSERPAVPLVGVIGLAALVLLFEHFRRRGARR